MRKTADSDRTGTHPELPKKIEEPSTQQQIQEPEEISMSQRSPCRKINPTPPEPQSVIQETDVEMSDIQDNQRRLQQTNLPQERPQSVYMNTLQEEVSAMAQSPRAEEINEEDRPSKRYPTRKRKKTPRYIETC